jgi:hypothetical protein
LKREQKAREIAAEKAGDEGAKAWKCKKYSTCVELKADDFENEIVVRDFARA